MYIQPEIILEQYDLTVEQVGKGRGTYICSTGEGMKMLVPFRGSPERAEFLRKVLLYLKESGFAAEQITRTKDGAATACDDLGGRYLLKDMVSGTECNMKNRAELKAAVGQLAALHNLLDVCPIEIPEFLKSEREEALLLYEKHSRELVKVKNYIKSRKKKNEFEIKFQENYRSFLDCADKSVRLLKEETKGMEYRLRHGEFNQHNVVNGEGGWRIIHFETLDYNLSVYDLANFLRKMLEKNNWNEELAMGMIGHYAGIRPLSGAEYKQLYLLLLFPEKFWKLANHYYNSHKAWLSGRDVEKLDKVIAQEESRRRFLENLFSFIG